ncbi:MAG: GNAT family N-acetyltransferase [Actinobacteria bacterium]|nr:GNAT family N-acetyltransferase [Actinomycetota bacterium]
MASDGAAIAGFSICRQREEDAESGGWVSLLGVRPHWRGRGLGESLLLHSLGVFKERGRRRAALNVDVDNTTGALRLYEKVGMEPVPAFTIWSKNIGKG